MRHLQHGVHPVAAVDLDVQAGILGTVFGAPSSALLNLQHPKLISELLIQMNALE